MTSHCRPTPFAGLLAAALFAATGLAGRASAQPPTNGLTPPVANCSALVVTGDPQAPNGATWTYDSVDLDQRFVLEGVLFTPAGAGPFPAVVLSHGAGGTPRAYSSNIARTMVGWGLVAIGTMYTHAPDAEDAGNQPQGEDGASAANVARAHKARDLLSCLGTVDLRRVAAHGHSMGAWVTGQLLGTYPADFRAASHTAGGVSSGPRPTQRAAAERITTPYQLHHSEADTVVPLAFDQTLDAILEAHQVPHHLHWEEYPGFSHSQIAAHPQMLERVRIWYLAFGVLP